MLKFPANVPICVEPNQNHYLVENGFKITLYIGMIHSLNYNLEFLNNS